MEKQECQLHFKNCRKIYCHVECSWKAFNQTCLNYYNFHHDDSGGTFTNHVSWNKHNNNITKMRKITIIGWLYILNDSTIHYIKYNNYAITVHLENYYIVSDTVNICNRIKVYKLFSMLPFTTSCQCTPCVNCQLWNNSLFCIRTYFNHC